MKTVIIGAGLAGLTSAYYMKENNNFNFVLLEAQNEIGGLARSIRSNGFTFDYSIHMLHLRNPEIIKLVKAILPEQLIEQPRKAGILINKAIIPYPFQNNLYHIKDVKIKNSCVNGIIKASKNLSENYIPKHFKDWILYSQGEGIAEYFMIPYNEKCFGVDLEELNLDWLGRFVPQPDIKTILEGSKSDKSQDNVGYNFTFYYTKSGGIDWLPKALVGNNNNIKLSEKVLMIDLQSKLVETNKSTYIFDKIISTMPINELISKIQLVPKKIIEASKKLRCNSVSTVLLGIDRKNISDLQWLYLPDKDILPYRLSFPMNYSENMSPDFSSSVCAEYSYFGKRDISDEDLVDSTIQDLIKVDILKSTDKIIFQKIVDLKNAYVIFDENRSESMRIINEYLESNNIYSIGRFGNWEYSSMEDAMYQGMQIVKDEIV